MAEQGGGALRRMMLVFAVALVMAAMLALSAGAASAGNGFAKGQNNTNPGAVNNSRGDMKATEKCGLGSGGHCAPFFYGTANSPHGIGVQNN